MPPDRRGVAASVLRTLSFHVASLGFACVLCAFFAVTGSALLLVLGCLLAGSSQFARKLTRVLWRTEMAINSLVAEQGELSIRRRRADSQLGVTAAPVLGEVTLPVMLLSLLYFLVFKWVLGLVFSAIPLLTWVVSVAQVLPKDAGLSDVSLVVSSTTAAQVFTALAFAFLAHQIGVTSARGLLFVSTNVSAVLFWSSGDTEEASTEQEAAGRVPFAAQEGRRGLERRKAAGDYGTMGGKQQKPSAEAVTRNLYRDGRSSSESSAARPRAGAREKKQQPASFDGGEYPYVPPRTAPPMPPVPDVERAFRNDADNSHRGREVEVGCCKIVGKIGAGLAWTRAEGRHEQKSPMMKTMLS
ncbi:serine/threonine protein kinase [Phytophthora cinnamomi]|uniref:serine/threonine protein kinase n=1 Tax=Phytophthora cinnamomi TaxID=4785 RepID=UPI00355A1113|nr:serine/threonine protein kinase [Phytophthora cinnamomi]